MLYSVGEWLATGLKLSRARALDLQLASLQLALLDAHGIKQRDIHESNNGSLFFKGVSRASRQETHCDGL